MIPRLLVPATTIAMAAIFLPLLMVCGQPLAKERESAPPTKEQASMSRRMENAIARKLLNQAKELLPYVQQTGIGSIKRKLEQFDRAVNRDALTGENNRQRELLGHLVDNHGIMRSFREGKLSFEGLVAKLATLPLDLPSLQAKLSEESARLDALPSASLAPSSFPNSYQGRQAYLDELQTALVQGHKQWYEVLEHYGGADLAVTGTEASEPYTFRYQPEEGALLINLSDMANLPSFELPGLAVLYGFPGVHTLYRRVPEQGLQRLVPLAGPTLGWGAYLLEFLSAQGENGPGQYLRLRRLLVSLAQADIGTHTDSWTQKATLAFLTAANPDYPTTRLKNMAAEIADNPGTYTAIQASRFRYQELLALCQEKDACTPPKLHRLTAQAGPLPLPVLESLLRNNLLSGD